MSSISETIKKLSKLVTHQPMDFAIASSFVVVLALVELPLPIFMAILIDKIIPAGDVTNLCIIGLFLFGVRVGGSIFQVMQNFLVARIINIFTANIQKEMIYRILRLPYVKFTSAEAHGMSTRFNQDIEKVSEFAQNTIAFLIRPALSFIFIMTLMMFWNLPLALYCLIIVPFITLATRLIRNKMETLAYEQRKFTEKLEVRAVEALSNVKIIRTFNCEPLFQNKVDTEINQLEQSSVRYRVWTELANGSIEFIKTTNNIGFIFFAAHQVFQGNLTIGGFVALQTMSEGIRSPIAQIMYFITNFKSKAVALEKVNEVILEPLEQSPAERAHLTSIKNNIEFKNISLKYGEKEILKNIQMNIAQGQMIALVGPSGAGKTSLTNILLGLVKPSGGHVKIDGINLDNIDIYSFRKHIGVVYQESILFNNNVRYNMHIGNPNATDEMIWDALKTANAFEFIQGLPNELDTVIGVNGIKLSGGQQQRLSIARAVLANPAIMILDEATSSLDSTSESEIKTALDNALKGRTSIIVAHRLSTIVNADQIYVFSEGEITEHGTHQELIKNSIGLYAKLYKTQTEELIKISGSNLLEPTKKSTKST
jgi:ABC-type multidrug transport system fused ATPase/permease subunit